MRSVTLAICILISKGGFPGMPPLTGGDTERVVPETAPTWWVGSVKASTARRISILFSTNLMINLPAQGASTHIRIAGDMTRRVAPYSYRYTKVDAPVAQGSRVSTG